MWSDPDDIDNWAVSPRGAGWLFGGSVTQEVRPLSLSLSLSLSTRMRAVAKIALTIRIRIRARRRAPADC